MGEKQKDIFSGIGQRYWWVNEESNAVLNRGYLLRGETVEDAVNRVTSSVSRWFDGFKGQSKQYYASIFKEIIEKGWLSMSSPIWANEGSSRGFSVSCFGMSIHDSISGIAKKLSETIIQTKNGAGTSGYFGNLRGRGAAITNNGVSSGAVSFMELFNTTMNVVSQGSTRRGSFAAYLDIDHPDIEEFLTIKDIGSPIQNLFYGVCVPDYWMKIMINEDGTYPEEEVKRNRKIWSKVLESRQFKGLPYIFFTDNVNRNKPQIWKKLGEKITHSNLCFTGNTTIMANLYGTGYHSDNRYITFEDLYSHFRSDYPNCEVLTRDIETGELVYTKVKNVFLTGYTKEMVMVTTNYNETVVCTPEHRFLIQKDGKLEWVEAKDLQKRHKLDSGLKGHDNHIYVEEVNRITYKNEIPVYCLEVDHPDHNFLLGRANCLVSNCVEISQPDNENESFICCLSSMNLELFDEWYNLVDKNTGISVVGYAHMFLDGVLSGYIEKLEASEEESFLPALRSAKKNRAIGLGVMGLHSYYQKINRPFEHPLNMGLNRKIFGYLKQETDNMSIELGKQYGYAPIFDDIEGDIVKERNVVKLAIAPTTSSSAILGQVSPGIEPFSSNFYKVNLAKGNFIRKNKYLEKLLNSKLESGTIKTKEELEELWSDIMIKQGSVQHISEDILSAEEKDIFKTFKEISQYEIILQASTRQEYIDQSQSLNLNIPPDTPPKEVNGLIIKAWKLGIKTLYYQRSQSVSKELLSNITNCISCEG